MFAVTDAAILNIHEALWRHKALIKYAQLLFMTYEEFL